MIINSEEIYQKIQDAKTRAGRFDKISFVAVSKTRTVEEMKEAEKISWVDYFGENRVQEAETKRKNYDIDSRLPWRLIGHLQANKARKAIEIFDSIDSLDSIELAERINRIALEYNKIMPVLIEVKTSGEESKTGVAPEDFSRLLEFTACQKNLRLDGLMTIAPLTNDEREIRTAFESLRKLHENAKISTGLELPILSMGMSDDFEFAILEGSTMIRIGTLLFGPRDYDKK